MDLYNVKPREVKEREQYTGVIPMKVVAINPSHEELKELLNTDKINAPVYVSDNKTRLDIWVQNKELDILTKMNIWLENKTRVAVSSGNTLWINQFNQSTWAPSLEDLAARQNMNWFDKATARECKIGEDTLYNFIVALINADTSEGGIIIPEFNDILSGNVDSLKKLFEHYNDREIKLLVGIKDGRYVIYNKYFMRNEIRSTKALQNALEGGMFKCDYYQINGIEKYTGQQITESSGASSETAKSSLF